nr:NAD(P)H-dependent oxidoreductase [uncultured Holophaga sp.]
MNVLVVLAHPEPTSFTQEVGRVFLEGLLEAGHTFEVADLYAEAFDPILKPAQFALETAMDSAAKRPGDIRAEQARLARAEGLVFIYPFWWSDVPAILKGWFDRVWSYGFAYAYEADRSRSTRLTVQKALAIAIAGHSDEKLDALGLREAHRRIMVEDRLLGVGIPEAALALLGGLSGNLPAERARIRDHCRKLGREF